MPNNVFAAIHFSNFLKLGIFVFITIKRDFTARVFKFVMNGIPWTSEDQNLSKTISKKYEVKIEEW